MISLGIALLLIIAALKLGAAGVTLTISFGLVVGSYSCGHRPLPSIFSFKWIRKQEGWSGYFVFSGLLLIFEAYLVWKYGLSNQL